MIEDLLIVAAGKGTRLKAKGNLKPLVELEGKSLIRRAVESAAAAGIKRATVVTGYHAEVLEDHLKIVSTATGIPVETVYNPRFEEANGLSVLAAKAILDRPFCLAMCDHLVEPGLYHCLLEQAHGGDRVTLAVDFRMDNPYVDLDDVTRVQMQGNRIKAIAKDLEAFNAFDTGVFAAGPILFEAIETSIRQTGDCSISGGMKILAANDQAFGLDIADNFWIDVDSPEMHQLAAQWLRTAPSLI